ncbi:uncharacterized protein LOC135168310 [Diachasmimorpha longicaudata]|uniref:uncharacterized protein LOC135168310 n=1 Tax=Diachasmimorpha longicaudata TaxID=58733 RepID=UPI0030B8BC45
MVLTGTHGMMETGILLLLIIYLGYRYMTRNFDYWRTRGVVCVPPSPFFGNFGDFLMGRQSVGGFLKHVYDYSPDERYVGFFGFDKPMLLIRDPDLIKQILIKDFDYFQNRYANAGAHDVLGSSNLFIIKNPEWKYLRTKISPIYTSGKLRYVAKLMLEVGQDLIAHIDSLNLKDCGRIIEMKELCARFATDMIATTAFGLRANCLNDPNADFRKYGKEVFRRTFYRSVEQTSTFFAPFLMTPLKFNIFSKRVTQFLRSAVWEAIADRKKSGVKRHDLIDLLIELKNQDVDNPDKGIFAFEGDNIVAQAAVFFIAGFETASTPLSFTLYELALHPKMQDRLRKEITDAMEENGGEITYDTIMKLPYLDMVTSESLRKYPPLPVLDRVANLDYRVPGSDLVIEKGTPVYMSLFGLHYDPKYYDNPEKFDPERFSDANRESNKKTWYAFGDGPHVCIGMRLGLLESKVGLVSILQKYEVYPCEKTAIPMKLRTQGLMTGAEGGLYLNIKKIKQKSISIITNVGHDWREIFLLMFMKCGKILFASLPILNGPSLHLESLVNGSLVIAKMVHITNQSIINTVIIVLVFIYLIYRYMIRKFDYWQKRDVVYVPPVPFFGNFRDFLMGRKSAGTFLQEIYNYAPNEPYIGFFGFDKPMLMIRDTNLIKHILIKDFDNFKDRYVETSAHDILGGANLFVIKNPAWKHLRTKMSPIATSGRLKKMVQLMADVGKDLVTHLDSLGLKESGQEIEMKELCASFTTDMIATTAFGLRANSLNNPKAEFRERGRDFFRDTWYRSIEQIAFFFAPFLMTPLRLYNFPKKFSEFIRVAVWDAITDREASGTRRHDLIDLLIELKNQEGDDSDKASPATVDFEFKGDNLVAQASVFFVAGFETTSTALSFSLYELALHPEMQIRLRKEIIAAIDKNNGEITYEMITQLPYLEMVILEALRKYPPLPLLDRVPTSDYRVPGTDFVIEKGTPVYISLMGLHYDPKYHENPEAFDPERFSEANKESTKKAWYAFGDGPHVCIGQRLGLLEVKMGLIEMLRKYEFSPCKRTAVPMKFYKKAINTAAEGGLYLNIKKLTL